MTWWWVTFVAGFDRRYIGSAMVKADDHLSAMDAASAFLAPPYVGGIAGAHVSQFAPGVEPPIEWRNLLLTRLQCEEMVALLAPRSTTEGDPLS